MGDPSDALEHSSVPPPRPRPSHASASGRAGRDRSLEYKLGQLLYVGFFLFMGATDLLPEAHRDPSRPRVALTAAGFVGIFLVSAATRA